eukprot:gene27287-biopygen17800
MSPKSYPHQRTRQSDCGTEMMVRK